MGIKFGNSELKKRYIGATEVKSVYIGNTKVWPTAPIFPQPYALYKFDGNLQDSSGNNRHITQSVTPQFTAGVGGRQALLCGSYLDINAPCTPFVFDNDWQDFLIVCKVFINEEQEEYPNIFDNFHALNNKGFNYQYAEYEQGGWGFGFSNQEPPQTDIVGQLLPHEQWLTMAFVRRRSDGFFGVFLGSNLIQENYYPHDINIDGNPLMIGSADYSERWLNGAIQDFAIYKGEYSDQQIIEIMNNI